MSSQNKRRAAVWVLQILLVGFVFYALRSRIAAGVEQLEFREVLVSWQFIAATALFSLAVLDSGWLWQKTMHFLGIKDLSYKTALRVNTASWLLKYVPGQVGGMANRLAWAKSNDVSLKTTLASDFYGNLFLTSSSIIIGGLGLALGSYQEISSRPELLLPFIAALAVLPLLVPAVFSTVAALLLRLFRRKPLDTVLSKGAVIKLQALYTLPRIVNAVGFVLLVTYFVDVNLLEALALGSGYVLAGIIGLFAFFVPSGIGVREAVVVIVAAPIVGADVAVALAIIARLSSTFADGILAILYGGIRWHTSR